MARTGFSGFALGIIFLFQAGLVSADSIVPWARLTSAQQEVLRPVASEWDTLPQKLQRNLLYAAKRYPSLTSEEKRRFSDNLEKWSKLTPEQRRRAREKFQAFSNVPAAEREKVKQMVREQEARKAQGAVSNEPPSEATGR